MSEEMLTAIELSIKHNVEAAKIQGEQFYLLDKVSGRGRTKCAHYHIVPQAV